LTNLSNLWFKGKIAGLRKQRNNLCAICKKKGNSRTLEFAHIHRTPITRQPRGRKERYYDILKHPKSYILAHRDCHRKKHAKQHSNLIKEGIREAHTHTHKKKAG